MRETGPGEFCPRNPLPLYWAVELRDWQYASETGCAEAAVSGITGRRRDRKKAWR